MLLRIGLVQDGDGEGGGDAREGLDQGFFVGAETFHCLAEVGGVVGHVDWGEAREIVAWRGRVWHCWWCAI